MTSAASSIRITSLQQDPHFRAAVSDRIWKAWWREEGYSFDQIDQRVSESLGPETVPSALVASIGTEFLGTVSLIDSDMDERPAYSPWIAALWVDPEHRRQGIGAALVEAAATMAFAAGNDTVYLCASPDNAPFYIGLGWRLIEENVAGVTILALSR
ncbi:MULTISPECIES: GNAT family N-acetyltransferase [unclassified Chelatococcus]|uniref:GNAT family N-acetyltransferase n=1 Tax=unclassified Chelatococcus TaxID=2638111 RepID=UPI001BCBF00E|nr:MULTISPECIES: GNAT family N-acetyltransferase [unclassified Chelatococcus]CAH1673038.1 Acetyltransferase of GNAT family [Hyphomicrobiales bacterium]MBS7738875.1 GNAT family N-acetyltransferase [Chelatococcus sp. HY11]MBX3547027.1 GNAT family N-acetyltransferase [Chelatococcus sp.]MCO5076597.1 GNAT family N-acetyltransferase [Chelatococcus sp.]CAH1674723.1 Acetyltransferase of GNAT family [Hyphomicrobiales bacterium]